MMKRAGGIAVEREIPRFARQTFVDWFRVRAKTVPTGDGGGTEVVGDGGGTEVVLWADTFTNYFNPRIAIAASEVLEAAGCRVTIPARALCCGRPLYDYGFLTHAKRLLGDILRELAPAIAAATPIVVLEPSCLAVFRDELVNLFPGDARAKRLSAQTFLLSEFLRRHAPGYRPPRVDADVMLHGHCHHKAVATLEDEEALLRDAGARLRTLDSGCCGMAGSFGFEADHYDVSMNVGELVLLPEVRRAARDTVIVADGFSCREQVAQATGRWPLHLAEVLAGRR